MERGQNVLQEEKKKSLFQSLFQQFTDPLILILLIAAAISILLGEGGDAMIIGTVVAMNSIIGIIQEGKAQIICTVDGYTDYFDIEITGLHLNDDNVNRGILLEITDSRLLEKTGGIIQGMSGAPIIQDGRIIGAVTHVLVQDAAKGYGIFIENMLVH